MFIGKRERRCIQEEAGRNKSVEEGKGLAERAKTERRVCCVKGLRGGRARNSGKGRRKEEG